MPKRSHQDFSETEASGSGSTAPKRSRPEASVNNSTDALAVLLENADELLECVTALKSQQRQSQAVALDSLDPATRNNLARLSSKLSPALPLLDNKKTHESSRNASSHQQTSLSAGPSAVPSISAPDSACFAAWTSAEIPKETPSLPSVLDPSLEAAALKHSGMSGDTTSVNYERLEWIGDAYLYLISSLLVYNTFKSLTPGRCSQLRELLVRNSTLAGYSARYGFHEKAKLPEEFRALGRGGGSKASNSTFEKTLGDIFEAYVGAVVLSDPEHGVVRVSTWLRNLWGQTLKERIKEEERTASTGKELPPKVLLASEIVVTGIKLRYGDLESKKKKDKNHGKLQLFSVGVYLDGWGEKDKLLGWGSALSKNEAGQKAAKMVLDNKKLIKLYSTKKKDFLAAQGTKKE